MEVGTIATFDFDNVGYSETLIEIPFSSKDFAYPHTAPRTSEKWEPYGIQIREFIGGGLNIRACWIDKPANEVKVITIESEELSIFWQHLRSYFNKASLDSFEKINLSNLENFSLKALLGLFWWCAEKKEFRKLHIKAYEGYYHRVKYSFPLASDLIITEKWFKKLYDAWFDFDDYKGK